MITSKQVRQIAETKKKNEEILQNIEKLQKHYNNELYKRIEKFEEATKITVNQIITETYEERMRQIVKEELKKQKSSDDEMEF